MTHIIQSIINGAIEKRVRFDQSCQFFLNLFISAFIARFQEMALIKMQEPPDDLE